MLYQNKSFKENITQYNHCGSMVPSGKISPFFGMKVHFTNYTSEYTCKKINIVIEE